MGQQNGNQFGWAENAGPVRSETFSRAFAGGLVQELHAVWSHSNASARLPARKT